MNGKVKQLFEYLLALRNLSYEPVRDLKEYEKHWFLESLPQIEGCYLGLMGGELDAYVEIHQQQFTQDYPEFSSQLGRALSLLRFDYTKGTSVLCPVAELKELLEKEWKGLEEAGQKELVSISPWQQFLIGNLAATLPVQEIKKALVKKDAFNQQLLAEYETWMNQWQTWANLQKQKRHVQKLYDYFFNLMQLLTAEDRPLEIVLGMGMLNIPAKKPIYHPLLTVNLTLEFDATQGIAKLVPSSKGVMLELEMFADVELPNQVEIMKLRSAIHKQGLNLLDEEAVKKILQQFIHYVHPEGQYLASGDSNNHTKYPTLHHQGVLFIREKSSVFLKEDLKDTMEYLEGGGDVPKTLQAIVDASTYFLEGQSKKWDEQLLFPLPANEEQKDIARRLEQNVAITVQGPPGTGKSHTIVNLISHLLAHGKRVLVTSEKEKALKVLAEKLPGEIQDLCVSVLGKDRQSRQQIEKSIQTLSVGLATHDERLLEKEARVVSRQLDMVRRQIQVARGNLVRFRELETKGYPWKDKLCQPYEMAQLLGGRLVKDKIPMDAQCPLSDQEFVQLWELKGRLPAKHKDLHFYSLPPMKRLLKMEDYQHLLAEEQRYLERMTELESMHGSYEVKGNRVKLEELNGFVEKLMLQLKELQAPLEQHVLEDCLLNNSRYDVWKTVMIHLEELMVKINTYEMELVNQDVRCAFYQHSKYDLMMKSLKERLESGKTIKKLYLALNGDVKAFYENTKINGKKISTLEDLKYIQLQKEKLSLLEQFSQLWNKNMVPMSGDVLDAHTPQILLICGQKINQLRQILQAVNNVKCLNEQGKSAINSLEYKDLRRLPSLGAAIELEQVKLRLKSWRDVYQTLLNQYKALLTEERMHPYCHELYLALEEKDELKFNKFLVKIQELNQLKEDYQRFYLLLEKLKGVMPSFASEILEGMGDSQSLVETMSDRFDYGRLQTFLESLEEWKPDEIELKLRMLEKEESTLVTKLIGLMTWKHQLNRVTPEEDRALQTWVQKINRIGKGTGRHVQKLQREAREEMEKCQTAIPVWIMPVKEALENFKADPNLFDVVIIDEASQCNVLGLPILMRAKKAVIVGDDQQISPLTPGISDRQVNELMQRYLYGLENENAYDLQTSLYDIATRVFSSRGKLMLKEHFRCVPEIIGFSNGLSYNNEMIPLKVPRPSEQFYPPIMTVYVEDGTRTRRKTNEEEAHRIVSDITKCVKNPAYAKKTMGVISLLGSDQAKLIQALLVEAIGKEEILKRNLICGDAYSFQGDERDVMFLSLVIAPNMRYNALSKKMYTQRFNVAASRAKCQMRLYHSVKLDQLSREDLRYEFLSYCQQPQPVYDQQVGVCETILERDVMAAIEARGYNVRSQVQVGKYQIDLVIEDRRNRLAVECDGDIFYGGEKIEQDLERQYVLERVGWTFERIRGSVFYRHPDQALQPVWEKLEELNIHPMKKNQFN